MDMTELQRERFKRRQEKYRTKLATEVEKFKKIAAPPISYSEQYYDIAEYADPRTPGLTLRVMALKPNPGRKEERPEIRWFFKRPGKRTLELSCFKRTPDEVRKEVAWLLAGDEGTILRTYLNNVDVDSNNCHCFYTSDLLQEKTLEELEDEVEQKRWYLARAAEEGPKVLRKFTCYLRPIRCRLRHLEAVLKRYAKFREREGFEIRIKAKPYVPRRAA